MPAVTNAAAETVTLTGLELCKLGTWNASTGVTQITADVFASILAAANDPDVDGAAVKIGHVDARFDDGEPALGWVANLRVSDDGTTLVGDLVDVPAALADVIPKAFKRRSVEIAWNVKTAAGTTYRAALCGLALLGVAKPAVKGLADVLDLYRTPERTAAAGAGDATVTGLEVEDDDAGDGVEVPELVSALTAEVRNLQAAVIAACGTRPDTGSREPSPEGDGRMTDEQIRELYGLDAAAPITDQMRAIAGERTPDPADAPADPPTDPPPPPADPPADPTGATPELVTLSQSAFAELQTQAAAGAQAMGILRSQEIDRVVDDALRVGKFTVAEAPAYRDVLVNNFDGGKALISKLAAGKVPTTEIGSTHAAELGPEQDEAAWAAMDAEVFGYEIPKGA
jgi:hypothetical protein